MASTLEAAAKGLLSDPAWSRVFKNTYDALEEQLNKILEAVAAVALAVRFVSNLASGDLLCIVHDIKGSTEGWLALHMHPWLLMQHKNHLAMIRYTTGVHLISQVS